MASAWERSWWFSICLRRAVGHVLHRDAGDVDLLVQVDARTAGRRAGRGRSSRSPASWCRRRTAGGWPDSRRRRPGTARPRSRSARPAAWRTAAGRAGGAGRRRLAPTLGPGQAGRRRGAARSAAVDAGGGWYARLGQGGARRAGRARRRARARRSAARRRRAVGRGADPDHRRLLAVARRAAGLLEAEQDHGDVVAAAGLVGLLDQPLAGPVEIGLLARGSRRSAAR